MRHGLGVVLPVAVLASLAACSAGTADHGTTTVTVTQGPPTTSTVTPSTPTTSTSVATSPSSQPPTLKSAFARVRSGVVRMEVATCEGASQGSGFVVGERLVATVAHVVEGAQVVRVIDGSMSTSGTVIGLDAQADVALVRTSVDVPGKPVSWSSGSPEVGDEVAALGFTRGEPLSFKPGSVNSLDRKQTIEGVTRHGLLELDFAANHGNSGGPVINARGQVVGLVDAQTDYVNDQGAKSGEQQGDRLAVAAATAQESVDRWTSSPRSTTPPDCSDVTGPDGEQMPADQYPQDIAQQAFQTLRIYFASVNNGDYPTALAQLAHPVSVEEFAKRVKSADDTDFEVGDVSLDAAGEPVVWLRFQSQQDAGDGPADRPEETCTRWSLDYRFSKVNGLWLIDRARAHGHEPADQPCS